MSTRRVWRTVLTAAGVLLLAVLAACGSSEDAGGDGGNAATSSPATGATTGGSGSTATGDGSGGTLRIAMSSGNIPFPNTPPNEGYEGRRFVGNQVYDALYQWDMDQGDTVPVPELALAESVEMSEDQLTWTFKLREGVTFHDGTAFDAESVMFQFDRLTDPEFEFYDQTLAASNAANFSQIESYEMVDQYTISITTRSVYSFLPYDLVFLYFPSPAVIQEVGNDEYINHASGTGPFKVTKYVDGQVMELTANEEYWGGRPRLDKIELYAMPEPATRLAALQSGDVDWAEVPPPDSVQLLEGSGYQVLLKPYPHVITYQLNTLDGPFADVRVRQAVNYAVDREGTAALINNVGYPAMQYAYPEHPWFDPEWEGYGYDPDRARELLAEAGYADGLTIRIVYPTGGSGNMFPGPMNEKLQQDLAAVGITAELIPLEWNNILTGFRAGFGNPEWAEYDALYFSHAPLSPIAARSYVGDFIAPDGCCNTSNYSNPEVDALFHEAAQTFDVEEQDRLLRELHSSFMKDAPALITVHDLNLRVLSPKVKNFVQPQSWFVSLMDVYVEP